MPKAFRSYDSLNDYTTQVPGKYDNKQKLKWLGFHLHAELRSVFIFLETADKLGIETPINPGMNLWTMSALRSMF